MDDYEPDEYELEGYRPRGHEPQKGSWFGTASMMFGVLAFGTAFLSYLAASAYVGEYYKVRRYDYGFSSFVVYFLAVVITMVPAFGSVVSGFISRVKGERSGWLLLPGLVWLGPVLLFLGWLLVFLIAVILLIT